MDLTLTRAQYDAVRGARHLPDVLKKCWTAPRARKAATAMSCTSRMRKATALNELCAWNVHTDASGGEARIQSVRRSRKAISAS